MRGVHFLSRIPIDHAFGVLGYGMEETDRPILKARMTAGEAETHKIVSRHMCG